MFTFYLLRHSIAKHINNNKMKKLTLVFLLCLLSSTLFCQVNFIERTVSDYRKESNPNKTIFVDMKFGNYENDKVKHVIPKNAEVLYVDVVYSDFPKGKYYRELNQNRAKKAKELFPELKKSSVPWNLVKQTACKNKKQAEALFHGVVIVYREKPTLASMKEEIGAIKSMLSGDKTEISFEKDIPIDSLNYSFSTSYIKPINLTIGFQMPQFDSMFFNVFKRNTFEKAAFVGDVTGSMSPYSTQFLLWLKLNENNKMITSYTFFNDGDNKSDRSKIIGKTGGIYSSKSTKYKDVEATMFNTMMKGGGGDGPENNIEAIIKIQEMDPNVKEIILVADNYAPVKDIKLLASVTKPVHVIICGNRGRIHPDYIQIAFKTGGSLHTIEDDLLRLSELKNGEVIEFGGLKYKVITGGLELIYTSK